MRWHRCALAVLLSGCGTHHQATPDLDAPDAARGTVSVQVVDLINAAAPVPGARVLISDPDGSIFAIVTADANGRATGQVLPGGSVSVLPMPPLFPMVETVLDAQPGDHLIMGRTSHRIPSTQTSAGTLTAEFSTYPGNAGYSLYTSCGDSEYVVASPASVSLEAGCTSTSALVVARGLDGPLASVWVDPQPVADGTSMTMPPAWMAVGQFTANLFHVRAGLRDAYVRRSTGPAFADGEVVTSQAVAPAPGDLAITVPLLAAPAALVEVVIDDDVGHSQMSGATLDATAQSFDLDLATDLLPWLGLVQFDPGSGMLHENVVDLPPAAVVETDIHGLDGQEWVVFGPTAQDVLLPTLPPDVALPPGTHGTLDVTLGTSNALHDYSDVRAFPFQALDECAGGPTATGTHWRTSAGSSPF